MQQSIKKTEVEIETAPEEEKVPLNEKMTRLMFQLEKLGGEYEGTLIHHKHLGEEGKSNRARAEAAVKQNTAQHASAPDS